VNATFFALPVSLFPAINAERFGGNPRTLGLLMTAVGVGGLVSAVFAGPLKHMSRHGLVMLAGVAVWGGAFALFAVAPSLWLTLLALAIAGLADTFTVVVRGIIVQEATPDEFRGRVNAADFLVGAGGSQLGSLEAGLVGSWTTPVISALSGGLLTVFGVLAIGATMRGFRRYQSPTSAPEPPAVTHQTRISGSSAFSFEMSSGSDVITGARSRPASTTTCASATSVVPDSRSSSPTRLASS
jgi:MFS family permease